MLVVESVVPGGPADGVLEPGDVLVRLQGQVITSTVQRICVPFRQHVLSSDFLSNSVSCLVVASNCEAAVQRELNDPGAMFAYSNPNMAGRLLDPILGLPMGKCQR